MDVYTRKPTQVMAHQYNTLADAETIADWMQKVGFHTGRVSKMLNDNLAPVVQVVIPGKTGIQYAKPGDWVIREGGRFRAVSDEVFRSTYEPASE